MRQDLSYEKLNIDNPYFTGRKWGLRFLLTLFYFVCLSLAAIPTFSIKFSAFGIIAITQACLFAISAITNRYTRNWFRRRHQQYGFMCLMFIVIAWGGATQYVTVESTIKSYQSSQMFQAHLERFQNTPASEIPIEAIEDSLKSVNFLRNNFPELLYYAQELWKWKYIRDSSSLPWIVYLVIYAATGIKSIRKKKASATEDTASRNTYMKDSLGPEDDLKSD